MTHLIPALLDLVDEERIAFSVGVELSYLPEAVQRHIAALIERDEATPSYSQAVRMHKENDFPDLNHIRKVIGRLFPAYEREITDQRISKK